MACKRSGVRIPVAPLLLTTAGHFRGSEAIYGARPVPPERHAQHDDDHCPDPGIPLFPQVTGLRGSPEPVLAPAARGQDSDSSSPQVSGLMDVAGYQTGYRQAADPEQIRAPAGRREQRPDLVHSSGTPAIAGPVAVASIPDCSAPRPSCRRSSRPCRNGHQAYERVLRRVRTPVVR